MRGAMFDAIGSELAYHAPREKLGQPRDRACRPAITNWLRDPTNSNSDSTEARIAVQVRSQAVCCVNGRNCESNPFVVAVIVRPSSATT